jgi:hypothetical protein
VEYIVIIVAIFGGAFYLRHRTAQKVYSLINEIDELSVELEVVIRSEDFTSLELIVQKSEEISKAFPLPARFGELKHLRTEFLSYYNPLVTRIEAVYRELEIRQRVNERDN